MVVLAVVAASIGVSASTRPVLYDYMSSFNKQLIAKINVDRSFHLSVAKSKNDTKRRRIIHV